ncbi:MAG: cbb3-type cytochrome oxidase assembly protein CcoS [Chitinophagales bacterium]|nr:cbb3-type cytochrome oxidase assembly protein CcoS [Bacteroidota bacterium]MBX7140136.1 cbb3-type cytochrome oxidase assembly protein CcoS [Chitinophagales bacterium]
MTAIILLIVCSMIVAGGFLVAFLKSVKNGQYDDTYTPSVRMLFDDATVERSADHVKSKEDSNTEINS